MTAPPLTPRRPARARPLAAGALAAAALVLAACAGPAPAAAEYPDSLVLATAQEVGEYNPVNGYAQLGVSPVFEGLLRPATNATTADSVLPDLEPALAAGAATPNDDATSWIVSLRPGVRFSDGTALDAADVAATYSAVLDPASASKIASEYEMIDRIVAIDPLTVRFDLRYPYAALESRLLLGIAPSERLAGGLASESDLNTDPVGTGPYTLDSMDPGRAVFTANPDYWGAAAAVNTVTEVFVPDDNARAQQMATGAIAGTTLPPRLAQTFESVAGTTLWSVKSADWRGLSLPPGNPFTADPAARLAMNLAAHRQGIVDHVLAGHGAPASTPVADIYDAHDPAAVFPHDIAAAQALLDDAGWRPGAGGVRVKDGARAEFTVLYPATDTLRRDVATAFAADMRKIGVQVGLTGSSWDEISARAGEDAILLGGGDNPYDLDSQAYDALHTPMPQTALLANPGGWTIPGVDAGLDRARRSLDPAERATAYRQVQSDYLVEPSSVFLVFLEHTYVSAENSWGNTYPVLEPHAHGVGWGPWWNVARWTR